MRAGAEVHGSSPCVRTAASSPRKRRTVIVCVAILASLPIAAQQTRIYQEGNAWVEETKGTLPAARELRISTDVGAVEVRGNASNIAYVIRKRAYASTREAAQRQFQMMKVTATSSGSMAVVDGRLLQRMSQRMAQRMPNHFMAEISLQVPRETEKVRLDTGGGAMKISSIAGAVTGKTGAGAIKLDDITGPVSVITGGGEIVAGKLASDLTVKSGGGSVTIDVVRGQGRVNTGGGNVFVGAANGLIVENGAGSIDVKSCSGDLRANTGGGNVNLGDVAGSVQVDSGAGSVRLASASGPVQVSTGGGSVELFKLSQGAQVETGTGAITAEFVSSRGGFTDSVLHTAAGDVLVFLPGNLPVTVHASADMATAYGIKTDFQELRIGKQGGEYGPQSMWAEGKLNGGGPLLRVRTTIGHIDFRKGTSR
jgi:DUF4097 and DUF4098 domain-containing protein YvlB